MLPFLLLAIFLGLAVAAIGGFAVLAWRDQASRRDDFKKFLASFAGTALALSVGFMSLLLQQHNQAQQQRADEASKIRSGLLYSVIRKKVFLQFLKEAPGDSSGVCSEKDPEKQREKFKDVTKLSLTDAEATEVRELIERAFGGTTFQQGSLDELFRKTNVSSLLDRDLAEDLLEGELGLTLRGPNKLSATLDTDAFHDVTKYCSKTVPAMNATVEIRLNGERLQLNTCVAFSVLRPEVSDSAGMSRDINALAGKYLVLSGESKSVEGVKSPIVNRKKFWSLAAKTTDAAVLRDLAYCLRVAGMSLGAPVN